MNRGLLVALWSAVFVVQLPELFRYIQFLIQVESYGWLVPVATAAALATLFLWNWDRELRPASNWLSLSAVVVGLLTSCVGLLVGLNWLAVLACCISGYGFLVAQRDKNEQPLSYMWPLLLGIVIPPWGMYVEIQDVFIGLLAQVSGSASTALAIPHIAYADAIEFQNFRIEFRPFLFGAASWPLLVLVSLIYSAILRRHLFIAVANALLAVVGLLLFWVCVPVTLGYGIDREFVFLQSMLRLSIGYGCVLVIWFLSMERGVVCFFEQTYTSIDRHGRINPIALCWNRLFGLHKPTKTSHSSVATRVMPLAIPVLSAACIGAFAFSLVRWSYPQVGQHPAEILRASAPLPGNDVSYHAVSTWGASAETITAYEVDTVFELTLFQDSNPWHAVPSRRIAWDSTTLSTHSDTQQPGAPIATRKEIRKNETRLTFEVALEEETAIAGLQEESGNLRLRGRATLFGTSLSEEQEEQAAQRFVSAVEAVLGKMKSS